MYFDINKEILDRKYKIQHCYYCRLAVSIFIYSVNKNRCLPFKKCLNFFFQKHSNSEVYLVSTNQITNSNLLKCELNNKYYYNKS